MSPYQLALDWIESQSSNMQSLLETWANINSGSFNQEGLEKMLEALKEAFLPLGGEVSVISLPPLTRINAAGQLIEVPHGKALHIKKHPEAPVQVLFNGHYDTVFPVNSPFQKTRKIDNDTINGPGVADMKGGLIVMLKAIEALENSRFAGRVGWEVLIIPDEEIGSVGSKNLLIECAKRAHVGLIFEPATEEGFFVSARKGSSNFTVIARGKSVHVGRDFQQGRNAIYAMAKFVLQAERLTDLEKGILVNVGEIEGGGPANIVPDLAICRLNIRVDQHQDLVDLKQKLSELIKSDNDGITFAMHQHTEMPPKPFDEKAQALFYTFKDIAKNLGLEMQWKTSGGTSDGNLLAAEGLPVIDSLGVVGGNLHTANEYMKLSSLVERCSLTTLFLLKLANVEITV